jgi:hypothetical protein
MHVMIAAKYVMADWDNVVKRAGRGEENYDERKRENDCAVVLLHQCVNSGHYLAPSLPIRPLWQRRN